MLRHSENKMTDEEMLELVKLIQELNCRPELAELVKVAKDCTNEQIKSVVRLIDALNKGTI